MPVIHVYHPEGVLDSDRKAALAQRLTDVLLDMEGGARSPGGMSFATVLFSEVATSDWWVGGRTDSTYVHPPGKFLARVNVPEGYMSQVDKTNVHVAVNNAIVEVARTSDSPDQGASVMVIIDEIAEGNWGVQGKTISLASIADTVGLSKDGERFRWVRDYFAAKARLFGIAKYPPNTGGLLNDEVRTLDGKNH